MRRHGVCTMNLAMLISMLLLATGVKARPGGGGLVKNTRWKATNAKYRSSLGTAASRESARSALRRERAAPGKQGPGRRSSAAYRHASGTTSCS